MVKKILVTRPKHDIPTSYLYYFSEDILKQVKNLKKIHITNLDGEKANKTNFEKSLIKESPKLIFLNGHGNQNCVTGHQNKEILNEKNINLTKNKIVYALACNSLKNLGKKAIQKGTLTYIGYKDKFMVVRDITRTSNPKKDKNALPFKKACSTLINSLVLDRKTVEEAINLTKKEYINLIRSYGTSEEDPFGDPPLIRFALTWNWLYLDMEGNPSVKL